MSVSLYSFGNWFVLIIDFLKGRVLNVKTKIEHVIIKIPSFSSKEASMTLLFLTLVFIISEKRSGMATSL